MLQNLIITFVYSASDGSIHAVHHREEANFKNTISNTNNGNGNGNNNGSGGGEGEDMPKYFTVEYIWVEEADVDVQGGVLALFAGVLIVTLGNMVGGACSDDDEKGSGGGGGGKKMGYGAKGKKSSSLLSSSSSGFSSSLDVGGASSPSEGFAKRL